MVLKVHYLGRNSIIHIHAYNKLGILFVLQMLAPTLQQFSMLIVKNQGGEQYYKLINGINIYQGPNGSKFYNQSNTWLWK